MNLQTANLTNLERHEFRIKELAQECRNRPSRADQNDLKKLIRRLTVAYGRFSIELIANPGLHRTALELLLEEQTHANFQAFEVSDEDIRYAVGAALDAIDFAAEVLSRIGDEEEIEEMMGASA